MKYIMAQHSQQNLKLLISFGFIARTNVNFMCNIGKSQTFCENGDSCIFENVSLMIIII